MDPSTGRFISMDAYSGELGNPTSLHKYLYANANPVMYCDPSGYTSMPEALTSMAIQSAIGAAVGALIGANLAAVYCWANPELKKEDALQILWDGIKMGALFGASFGLLDGLPGVIAATKFASYAPMAYGICIGVEAGFAAYGVIDSAKGIVEAFQKKSVRLGIYYVITGGLSVYALGKLAGREYGLGTNGVGSNGNTEASTNATSSTNNGGNSAGNSGTGKGGSASGKNKLALGLSESLDDFALKNGASTWKDFPDPNNWRNGVLDALYDPNTEIIVNLDGVDNPLSSIQRAAGGSGSATDWELLQIKLTPESWDRITWYKDGNVVPNPFEY